MHTHNYVHGRRGLLINHTQMIYKNISPTKFNQIFNSCHYSTRATLGMQHSATTPVIFNVSWHTLFMMLQHSSIVCCVVTWPLLILCCMVTWQQLSHLLHFTGSAWAWKVCTLLKLDCQYLTKPLSSVVTIQTPLWLHTMLRTGQSWP